MVGLLLLVMGYCVGAENFSLPGPGIAPRVAGLIWHFFKI